MSNLNKTDLEVETIVNSIKSSKKYRHVYEETIRMLAQEEIRRHRSLKQAEKAARNRLHQIVAGYVGDADYDRTTQELEVAFQTGDENIIRETIAAILATHASTRERLEIVDEFYAGIFGITGRPQVILDVACALNPLTFLWMDLPGAIHYHAYDIHERRIEFLNSYFSLQGVAPLAKVQDVILHLPEEKGDVAFILKELHRIERHYGAGLTLLEALDVRHLVVSFPTVSLHGGRSLADHYRKFFYKLIAAQSWPVAEIEFKSELVFCVDKR
jgi:16S rRNA (guanine(1405)-N(7))-methyltransferase